MFRGQGIGWEMKYRREARCGAWSMLDKMVVKKKDQDAVGRWDTA